MENDRNPSDLSTDQDTGMSGDVNGLERRRPACMSAKHEKAIMIRQPKRTYAAEATAFAGGTPAFQSRPPSARRNSSNKNPAENRFTDL